jgi:cytochrome c553
MPQAADRSGPAGNIGAAVVLALIFAAHLTGSRADAADIATPEQAEGMVHVCSSCHGFGGRSISPTFPRLAGQQKDYLIAQLKSFRDKTRADPHAQTYMWGMAAHLSDPMIEGIAKYYSSQPPVAGTPSTSPAVEAGAKIFAEGLPAQKIAPCQSCHGPSGAGNGPFPRLAGQHQDYLVRQLEAFASEARANPIMHEMSKSLTAEQIRDVTAFLATQ